MFICPWPGMEKERGCLLENDVFCVSQKPEYEIEDEGQKKTSSSVSSSISQDCRISPPFWPPPVDPALGALDMEIIYSHLPHVSHKLSSWSVKLDEELAQREKELCHLGAMI